MAEKFFGIIDNLCKKVQEDKEHDYEGLLSELQLEFNMVQDDFRLMGEEEQNSEMMRLTKSNVNHSYFRTGYLITKKLLDIKNSSEKMEQEHTIENETDANAGAQEQLAYKDFVKLVKPIFTANRMEIPSALSMKMFINMIETVREKSTELGYPIVQMEQVLVAYIHGLLDPTTQELWAWAVIDGIQPTFNGLVQFLNKRIARMPSTRPATRPPLEAELVEPVAGPSNEQMQPKRQKKFACPKCEGSHPLCQCMVFKCTKLAAKQDLLKKKRLCESCFSPNHKAEQCPADPCKLCSPIKHNTIMCPKRPYNH